MLIETTNNASAPVPGTDIRSFYGLDRRTCGAGEAMAGRRAGGGRP